MTLEASTTFLMKLLIAGGSIHVFYHYGKPIIFHNATTVANFTKLTKHFSLTEVSSVAGIMLLIVSQLLFCLLLMFTLNVPWPLLGLSHVTPIMIIYGILLGVGEFGFSSLLYQIIITHVTTRPIPFLQFSERNNFIPPQSEDLRHFIHIARVANIVVMLLLMFALIGIEEMVFRGVMIYYFKSYNEVFAIGLPTLLFVYKQVQNVPINMNILFPVISALVIGVVHGILYLKTGLLFPLIIAHCLYCILWFVSRVH